MWSLDSSSSKLVQLPNESMSCSISNNSQYCVKKRAIIFYTFTFGVAHYFCNYKQWIICLNEIKYFIINSKVYFIFYVNHVKLSIKRIEMVITYISYSKLQLPLIQKAALLCFSIITSVVLFEILINKFFLIHYLCLQFSNIQINKIQCP